MSLNIYGNIGTTYSGIVTGAELERVSQEIFGGAQIQSGERISKAEPKVNVQPQPQVQETSPSQINLYNRNTDISLTQQVSQARVDFNVQLTPQALHNIEALRTLAATQQTNVQKLNDGKIYVPVDNSEKSDIQNVFALPHATSVLSAFSMDKDRKGSNPFSYTQLPSKNEEGAEDNNNQSVNFMA